MNVFSATGNLGADATMRKTETTSIVSFSVGVKAGYGDKATTTWVRCSLFGKRAEALSQYLTKGQLVGIVGEISLREYEVKGEKKTSLECAISDITLLGKSDRQKSSETRQETSDIESDIPF